MVQHILWKVKLFIFQYQLLKTVHIFWYIQEHLSLYKMLDVKQFKIRHLKCSSCYYYCYYCFFYSQKELGFAESYLHFFFFVFFEKAINRLFRPAQKSNWYEILIQIDNLFKCTIKRDRDSWYKLIKPYLH